MLSVTLKARSKTFPCFKKNKSSDDYKKLTNFCFDFVQVKSNIFQAYGWISNTANLVLPCLMTSTLHKICKDMGFHWPIFSRIHRIYNTVVSKDISKYNRRSIAYSKVKFFICPWHNYILELSLLTILFLTFFSLLPLKTKKTM